MIGSELSLKRASILRPVKWSPPDLSAQASTLNRLIYIQRSVQIDVRSTEDNSRSQMFPRVLEDGSTIT